MSDNGGVGGWIDQKKMDALKDQVEDLDDEQIEQAVQTVVQEQVVPALVDIRQRRDGQRENREIRAEYAAYDEETKQDLFDQAVFDVIEVLFDLRENPQVGVKKLRRLVRDPTVFEALLLIFDNPEKIDPEYAEELKQYVSMVVRWVGVVLAPEMYDAETVTKTTQELDLPVDKIDQDDREQHG